LANAGRATLTLCQIPLSLAYLNRASPSLVIRRTIQVVTKPLRWSAAEAEQRVNTSGRAWVARHPRKILARAIAGLSGWLRPGLQTGRSTLVWEEALGSSASASPLKRLRSNATIAGLGLAPTRHTVLRDPRPLHSGIRLEEKESWRMIIDHAAGRYPSVIGLFADGPEMSTGGTRQK
jgi:hypothetical protein